MGSLYDKYKQMSVIFFGKLVDSIIVNFESLRRSLIGSGINVLLKTWVCMIFMNTALAFIGSLSFILLLQSIFMFDAFYFIYFIIFVPVLFASSIFLIFYIYPIQRASSMRRSIENDLPFALSNMSAIASSGIPPEFMFELIMSFKEYGAIADQARMIVRNIKTFGMSSVNSLKNVAERSPSPTFNQTISGIASTIEKGGNLIDYLKNMSESSLFDYRLKREKYIKTLSTYADIYTALLVAAPLMMLAVLGIMSIIGGTVIGITIDDLIFMITWLLLPTLNILFLAFIHITYPGV